MPIAFDAVQTACANRLARNGFILKDGPAFISDFRAGQNKAWPGALRVLKTFMADGSKTGGDPIMTAMITSLPEESLRPFVDGLVGQMIADEIKGDSCSKIERGMELISPLPRENVGGLFAFIAEIADLKNPPVCPAPSAKTKK